MTEKELLKLKRSEMLEIMLAQSREIDSLRKEIEDLRTRLEDREIRISTSGSIAESSVRLTRVFEEAQKAADLYLENVRRTAAGNPYKGAVSPGGGPSGEKISYEPGEDRRNG